MLLNIGGELELLGISAMDHGSAEAQYEALVAQLVDYDLINNVRGLYFVTTAKNTGRLSATNIRFTRIQNDILLELACRHVFELHIKHFLEHISSGKTLAPENQLFKCFQEEWYDLKDDLSELIRFDVKAVRGTLFETQVLETIQFCKFA